MRNACATALAIGVFGLVSMGASSVRGASTPDLERDRPTRAHHSVEAQAIGVGGLLPHMYFGLDAAYVAGAGPFSVRAGAQVASGRAFALGAGRIANVLTTAILDGCGSKEVLRHRIRICVGGQAGMMIHRWRGYERPGRASTPWVAGTLKGDYHYAMRQRVGLLFGVGVSVPVVGPEFRSHSTRRVPTDLLIPGPVTGMLSVGVTFRLR